MLLLQTPYKHSSCGALLRSSVISGISTHVLCMSLLGLAANKCALSFLLLERGQKGPRSIRSSPIKPNQCSQERKTSPAWSLLAPLGVGSGLGHPLTFDWRTYFTTRRLQKPDNIKQILCKTIQSNTPWAKARLNFPVRSIHICIKIANLYGFTQIDRSLHVWISPQIENI
jgi:hypothetical protein